MSEQTVGTDGSLSDTWERLSSIDKKWFELAFHGFLLFWIVALLVIAWGWSWDNKLIPYVAGIPTALMLVVKLVKTASPDLYDRVTPEFKPGSDSTEDEDGGAVDDLTEAYESAGDASDVKRPPAEQLAYGVRMTAWSMALPILMYVIGFSNALVLFTLAFGLRFFDSPRRAVLITAVFSALMYVFFYAIMGLQPWPGIAGIPSIVDVLGLG